MDSFLPVTRGVRLLAAFAQTERIKAVSGESESALFGRPFQRAVDGALRVGRHDKVSHDTALDANQVVVMPDEVLVKFVASVIVAARNFVHHPGTLEVGKVPIYRALRQLRPMLYELRHAGRMPDVQQGINELSSAACIDEVPGTQTATNFGVNTVVCTRHRDERTCDEQFGCE